LIDDGSNFIITAYANNTNGNLLHTNLSTHKATFELFPADRIGMIKSISRNGNGNNLIFTDVMLKISGEDISSITYKLNKGMFIKDVTLTAKEVQNIERS